MRKTKSKVIKSLLAIVTKGSLVTGLVAGLIASANTQRHFVSQSGSSTVTQLSAESDLNKSSSPAKNDGQSIDKFLDNKDGTLLLKVGQQEAFKAWIKNTQKGSVTLEQVGGANVTNVGTIFQNVDVLTSITLPTTLEIMGADAFKGCTSLATVNLGQLDKLTTIGDNAFDGCTALTSVTIPAGVTAVADNAFAPNTAIVNNTKILFKAYVNSKGKVSVFNTPKLNLAFVDGGGYVKIADNAFANLTKIKDLIIPARIKKIGANAFGGCTGLKTVKFSGNIWPGGISIGKGSFPTPSQGKIEFHFITQNSLDNVCEQIDLPDDKKECLVDFKNFFHVSDQGVLIVRGSGDNLKRYLQAQGGILDISALDNVKVINDAFCGYYDLKNIILPTSLTTIGANTFKDCISLATVNFDRLDKLTTIGTNSFRCTALTSVTVPANVTAVADNAFAPNTAIVNNTKILFKAYVNSNGKGDVFNTPKLNLAFVDGGRYVKIADNAFANLTKVEEIIIPETIKEIGANAFGGCTSLKTVKFSGNRGVGSISIGKDSFPIPSQGKIEFHFIDQNSLNNVYGQIDLPADKKECFVDFKDIFYVSGQGVLTVKGDGGNLKKYLRSEGGVLDISVLKNVKVINDAFRGYDDLKDIILPTSLTTIGANAFKGCTSLATVNLVQLDKLTKIGKDAFGGCNALKSIAIPASITDIGTNAFDGCNSLKEVTFMGENRDITLGSDVFMKDRVEKFLFEYQSLLDALKNKLDAGIDPDKCSLITSGLSDGAIVGITLVTIFASICFVVGIAVLIRKRKMNALHHQDYSKLN